MVEIALGRIGSAAIAVGERVFRIEPDRLGEVRDGAVEIALDRVGETAVVMGDCLIVSRFFAD